jgi:hypothetical protein
MLAAIQFLLFLLIIFVLVILPSNLILNKPSGRPAKSRPKTNGPLGSPSDGPLGSPPIKSANSQLFNMPKVDFTDYPNRPAPNLGPDFTEHGSKISSEPLANSADITKPRMTPRPPANFAPPPPEFSLQVRPSCPLKSAMKSAARQAHSLPSSGKVTFAPVRHERTFDKKSRIILGDGRAPTMTENNNR